MPQRSQAHAALGRAVRELRKARKLSQEDLAWNSSVHRTYLGGIERGERNPTYANMLRIANALGISLAELVARAEQLKK